MSKPAIYALEDGTIFRGKAFGAAATTLGEAVFNTAMSGYQEILTDPSYASQIVTLTAPQVGNYGVNPDDTESQSIQAAGLVIRDLSPVPSNWRSHQSLHEYLEAQGIPGIHGIDTRALTLRLRDAGVMKACLTTEDISAEEAVQRAKDWPGLEGVDLAKQVMCKEPYTVGAEGPKVVALDFGVKASLLKKLADTGIQLLVLPGDTPSDAILAHKPDGVFLSNGPGDPAALTYAHETVRSLIGQLPIFGVCLGHQIITHAIGASTYKLKFGHRGGNHPVKDLESDRIFITSQNHGYAACPEDLEKNGATVTELNLNDNTVSGLAIPEKKVFSVQYHPEAAPGPNDSTYLFRRFREALQS